MSIKTITKNIAIAASPEKVWEVLLQHPYIDQWYNVFDEGLKVETDWAYNSPFRIVGRDGWGMVGKIAKNVPHKTISIEYTGMVAQGKDDYESLEAQSMKGQLETYRLTENGNETILDIEAAAFSQYYDMMQDMWDKALIKIKELSENN